MGPAEQRLQLEDIRLNVQIAGEGPAVVLLHGFPDSSALWREVIPPLVDAGYRTIAPDMRGFGRSDAPQGVAQYRARTIVGDVVRMMDLLGVERAHLIGHDWGAVIAWLLAGYHPGRFCDLTALSVGHPAAYARAGWEQKRKGWYTVFFQLRGIAERLLGANDFANFRRWLNDYPECDRWIADLSRPGRLTAALNWYRANFFGVLFGRQPRCRVPVLGVWSSRDVALAEDQMKDSVKYVDADWRYERVEGVGHWLPLEAPREVSRLILDFIGEP